MSGLTDAVGVAAGSSYSAVLKNDGTVRTWGWNQYGQLGNGTFTDSLTPVQAGTLSNVVAIHSGRVHTVALKNDGTVWAWGYNAYGGLGDGSTISRNAPVQVNGLTGVVAAVAGSGYTLALKTDGTVWAWGWNRVGQLGDGTTNNSLAPVQVNGLTGVVAVAAGVGHSIALKNDGTVWTWGLNNYGQLGDGTYSDSTTPVQVNGLTGVVAVANGGNYSLARKNDGTVWAWGVNDWGQLGNGTTYPTRVNTPVQVAGSNNYVFAANGSGNHSLAVTQSVLSIVTTSLADATVQTECRRPLKAAGGLAPYTWSISEGALPEGLSLDGPSGVISGIPVAGGTFNFTVQVSDANSTVSTKDFSITVSHVITASAGANGAISPSGPVLVNNGASQVFTITPDTGYHVAQVLVDGVSAGTPTTYLFNQVSANHTIEASFAINTYTVTPSPGANGSMIPAVPQTVNYNQTASFTVTPDVGYHIVSVTGCNGTLNGNIYTTEPITADCSISAAFAINTYTVTPSPGASGSMIPAVPQTVNYSQTTSFTVAANTGYHIASVTGCDGSLNGGTYTTGPITADCTVTASYAIDTHTLTVNKAGTGAGTVTSSPAGIDCGSTCSGTFNYGTAVTLTAARNADSFFAGWSGGGCSGNGTCVTTMTADKSVTATFTQYITVTAPNGGGSWSRGTTHTIRWTYAGNPGSSVKIELLKAGALNRTITSSTSIGSGGSGSYSWSISGSQALGSDYTIRVTSTSNSNYKDTSNANFSIN